MKRLYELTYEDNDEIIERCLIEAETTDEFSKLSNYFIGRVVEKIMRDKNKIIYSINYVDDVIFNSIRKYKESGDEKCSDEFKYDDVDHEMQLTEDLVAASTKVRELNRDTKLDEINLSIPVIDYRRELTLIKKIEDVKSSRTNSLDVYLEKE